MRCFFGFHYWVGRPPFGIGIGQCWCWRTCKRCGKQSYGNGYHEEDRSWEDFA